MPVTLEPQQSRRTALIADDSKQPFSFGAETLLIEVPIKFRHSIPCFGPKSQARMQLKFTTREGSRLVAAENVNASEVLDGW